MVSYVKFTVFKFINDIKSFPHHIDITLIFTIHFSFNLTGIDFYPSVAASGYCSFS